MTAQKTQLQASYAEAHQLTKDALLALMHRVETFRTTPDNWGNVGDLQHLHELLIQAWDVAQQIQVQEVGE